MICIGKTNLIDRRKSMYQWKEKKSNHKISRASLQGKLLVQRQTLWCKRSSLLMIEGKILSAWSGWGLFSNCLRSGSNPKAATRDCFQGDIFAFAKESWTKNNPVQFTIFIFFIRNVNVDIEWQRKTKIYIFNELRRLLWMVSCTHINSFCKKKQHRQQQ